MVKRGLNFAQLGVRNQRLLGIGVPVACPRRLLFTTGATYSSSFQIMPILGCALCMKKQIILLAEILRDRSIM